MSAMPRVLRLAAVALAATLTSVAAGALTVVMGPSLARAMAPLPGQLVAHLPAQLPTIPADRRLLIPVLFATLALLALAIGAWRQRQASLTPVAARRNAGRSSGSTSRSVARAIGRSGHRHLPVIAALAAAGTPTVDIARRTGLAIDAVHLMLAMSDDPRQLPPQPA